MDFKVSWIRKLPTVPAAAALFMLSGCIGGNEKAATPLEHFMGFMDALCEKEENIFERFIIQNDRGFRLFEDFKSNSAVGCSNHTLARKDDTIDVHQFGANKFAIVSLTKWGDYIVSPNYYVLKTEQGFVLTPPSDSAEYRQLKQIKITQ